MLHIQSEQPYLIRYICTHKNIKKMKIKKFSDKIYLYNGTVIYLKLLTMYLYEHVSFTHLKFLHEEKNSNSNTTWFELYTFIVATSICIWLWRLCNKMKIFPRECCIMPYYPGENQLKPFSNLIERGPRMNKCVSHTWLLYSGHYSRRYRVPYTMSKKIFNIKGNWICNIWKWQKM